MTRKWSTQAMASGICLHVKYILLFAVCKFAFEMFQTWDLKPDLPATPPAQVPRKRNLNSIGNVDDVIGDEIKKAEHVAITVNETIITFIALFQVLRRLNNRQEQCLLPRQRSEGAIYIFKWESWFCVSTAWSYSKVTKKVIFDDQTWMSN